MLVGRSSPGLPRHVTYVGQVYVGQAVEPSDQQAVAVVIFCDLIFPYPHQSPIIKWARDLCGPGGIK